jgi:hypothetical protein
MTRWYDIAPPHADIKAGDFDESVFAAKLGDVVDGTAPDDYSNAYPFYRKTYLTNGLEHLLQRVHRKLADGKGPGVVQLQTPFGGGKTHALILVWHYLENGTRIKSELPDGVDLVDANTAVIVGKDANVSEGFRDGSYTRRTLWGEIAYQLGGDAAYDKVKANDENRIAPGRADLRDLLAPLQPFVLLIDEVLEYVVRARGVKVEESTLGAQTLSFFDELTEAVAGLPNGLLIATLPSSEQEDFGDAALNDLGSIEKIFGRQQAIYTPVESQEVYSIIRQRLFADVDEAAMRDVVDRYVQFYQRHDDSFPSKATTGEYRSRMEQAYPFHPEVIDILYEKWSTFSSFQRTRGALQLLARVIERLYENGGIDLILPGDVDLGEAAIRNGFLEHLTPQHKGIVASDIVGGDEKSRQLDREHKQWNGLAERNATAIFLHSFTAETQDRGIDVDTIKLDVLRPDENHPLVDSVLRQQSKTLWYLNTRGDQYYFSNVPNLNRMVVDKKALVAQERVRDTLRRKVSNQLGQAFEAHRWPASSGEVPDDRALKLVVWDPENEAPSDQTLRDWIRKCGDGPRVYKNTLLFALPDADRHTRLQDRIRQQLALSAIRQEIEEGEHPALEDKTAEVTRRIRKIDDEYPQKVRELYHVAALPVDNGGDGIERENFGPPPAGAASLTDWFFDKLSERRSGKILRRAPSASFLKQKFLPDDEPISLRSVAEQFYKDVRLPMLRDDRWLTEAIAKGVGEGTFGLVRKADDEDVDPQSIQFGRRPGDVHLDEAGWLLVPAEQAREWAETARKERSTSAAEASTAGDSSDEGGSDQERGVEEPDERVEAPTDDTLDRVAFRASNVSANRFVDVYRGVIQPLVQEAGDFDISFEVDVSANDGVSKQVVEQQVMETLRQLGAEVERRDDTSEE